MLIRERGCDWMEAFSTVVIGVDAAVVVVARSKATAIVVVNYVAVAR